MRTNFYFFTVFVLNLFLSTGINAKANLFEKKTSITLTSNGFAMAGHTHGYFGGVNRTYIAQTGIGNTTCNSETVEPHDFTYEIQDSSYDVAEEELTEYLQPVLYYRYIDESDICTDIGHLVKPLDAINISSIIPSDTLPCWLAPLSLSANIETTPADLQLSYQWYLGNSVILPSDTLYSGANSSTLTINRVDFKNSGPYTFIAFNAETGQADTATFTIKKIDASNEHIQFAGKYGEDEHYMTVCAGNPAWIDLDIDQDGMYTYTISGDTAKYSLQVIDKKAKIDLGIQQKNTSLNLNFLNRCSRWERLKFNVYVIQPPSFTLQPQRIVELAEGSDFEFEVKVKSQISKEYQWFKNGMAFGSASERFPIVAATQEDAGYYVCRAKSECGETWSDTAFVTVIPVSSIAGASTDGLTLTQPVPNPASERAFVRYSLISPAPAGLHVTDVFGRDVLTLDLGVAEAGEHTAWIEAGGLPAGVYYCTLQTPGARVTRQFVVVR